MSMEEKQCRRAVFPGSFDPFSQGHANVVERGLELFDEVVIAVGYNINKPGWIPVDERVQALRSFYAQCGRVQVVKHDGRTVELAQKLGAGHILRGVRSVQDYAYELQMADVNRGLSGVDTVLLPALPQLACLSSSVVRELAHFGRRWQDMLPEGLQYHINM